ncbi:MAG: LysR family substrate-binding domain-containing protein, partial [Cyanothece sp. SIO2G6]|nr:LysR family substrate-binding domain-containing protein [Cyanothece sp. SIO2G6]
GETGQLVLGFEGSTYNDLVLNIIRELRTQYPDVKLVMREMPSGQQVEALRKGQLDAALLEPIAASDEITVVPLLVEPLMGAIAQTHPLANQSSLSLMQLAEEPWITGRSSDGCGLRLRIMAACRQAGFVPQVHQQTNDLQMILGFVGSGLGVTLLPQSACRSGVMGVRYLPLQDPVPHIEMAIAWEPKAQSPVLQSFLQLVGKMAGVDLPVG